MTGDLVSQLAMIVPVVILMLLVLMILKSNQNWISRIHRKVLIENPGTASGDSYTVKHVTEPPGVLYSLKRPVTGLITLKQNEILFVGYDPKDLPLRLSLRPENLDVTWIGKLVALSGDHWFSLKNGDKTHYFSAETGKIFGISKMESKQLYARIKARYGENSEACYGQ